MSLFKHGKSFGVTLVPLMPRQVPGQAPCSLLHRGLYLWDFLCARCVLVKHIHVLYICVGKQQRSVPVCFIHAAGAPGEIQAVGNRAGWQHTGGLRVRRVSNAAVP